MILGSVNADDILNAAHFPPGETISGNHFKMVFGKANQAVAAGRWCEYSLAV